MNDQADAEELDGVAELVHELGYLPLAIEQAAAYLHQNQLSPRAYLDLLTKHPAAMYDQAAHGAAAERTVSRIWRLTLDRLSDNPLAGQLLRIFAWYGPEPIPRSLFDDLAPIPQLQQALGCLAAYNMITLEKTAITVHRLVQAVARIPHHNDPHRQPANLDTARSYATDLLLGALPKEAEFPESWPTWRTLLPHIIALSNQVHPSSDTYDSVHLFNYAAIFLLDQGAITPALGYLERAYHAAERILGSDHPNTLNSLNNLAHAYQVAGDLDHAIQLHEQTLKNRERILGSNHPNTLQSRNNLACTYRAAWDLEHAIPLHERALAEHDQILGSNHPETLTARDNLAYAYQMAGDLHRAISLHERTLADRELTFGSDHRFTLQSENNLALTSSGRKSGPRHLHVRAHPTQA
ncbi:tetratricopeptide repeat protein [Nonomuraea sp. NPDC049158]|uniref:tetratricopeptide repeat protein n=1 Tax=Nonomuraea sp. NPDC049158 TaxID=3155649 RepID=UPI0033F7BCD9